jgi:hypothetical protein
VAFFGLKKENKVRFRVTRKECVTKVEIAHLIRHWRARQTPALYYTAIFSEVSSEAAATCH